MLHSEPHWDQVVKAELLCEVVIKLGSFELLEEQH